MEPAAIAITLSKIIGLSLAGYKASKSEGFDEADINAIKLFLETSSALSSSRAKGAPGALLLAITTQAFGAALARHWGGSETMVPGKTYLPDFIAKRVKPEEHGRRKEIEYRTMHAILRLQEPGDRAVGADELEQLNVLTSDPVRSPYYRELWTAFSNPALNDERSQPPLDLFPGTAREFERHFRLAFYDLMASDLGQAVRTWRLELTSEIAPTMRQILAEDLASWGTRHVFGNRHTPPPSSALPFMSLDAIYVEPFGRVDRSEENEEGKNQRIQATIRELLDAHCLVVVQADFGHGKSLTARRFARDLARNWLESTSSGIETPYPVFVKCVRDIIGSSYKHDEVLRRSLYSAASEVLGSLYPKDALAFAPPSHDQRTVIILDGLDEIAFTQNQLNELFTTLNEALTKRHRAVLFTRPGALHPNCLPKGTPVVELQKFETDQINEWLARWRGLSDQRAISTTDIAALGALELAKVPILLLMIAMVGQEARHDGMMLNRADLYSRFFAHLARGKFESDTDEHKGIRDASAMLCDALRKDYDIVDPVEAMLWLMSRIGWEAHVRAYGEHSTDLQKHHVETIIKDELRLPAEIAQKVTIGLLLALQYNPSGDSASILFGHQSFREFSVARYWYYQIRRLKDPAAKRMIREELSRGRLLEHEDKCFEFLRDLAGQLENDVAQTIRSWAEGEVNDERLSAPSLWEDRRHVLRENCLAIGSLFGKIRIETPHTLRSIWSGFDLRCESIRFWAPGLQAAGSSLGNIACEYSFLEEADLREVKAGFVNFSKSQMRSVNFEFADLHHAKFAYSTLADARMQGADLTFAALQFADLRSADLEGANLQGAHLRRINLEGAVVRGARLNRTNLREANLQGANIQGANLQGANLQGANLQGANLQGADLRGADLRGADFRDAALRGTRFQDARPDESSPHSQAIYDPLTQWPEGFDPLTMDFLDGDEVSS